MKKLFLSAGLVLAMSGILRAQDCAAGYCPTTITVHHKVDAVSPVTVDITYGVVATSLSGTQQCWITRNLGATTQATAWNDATTASAGWYWQFGLKQGYSYSTGSRVPNTTWITPILDTNSWLSANDPCTLLLGSSWRLPTYTEWQSVVTNAAISSGAAAAYATTLKLHAAGRPNANDGTFVAGSIGVYGNFWSGTALSTAYPGNFGGDVDYGSSQLNPTINNARNMGMSVRCLRTY